jgi:hypothetical protein
MELLDSLVILQVECEKYMFLDKHQIIFGIKMQDQVFFQTPIGKWVLVKEIN